MAIEPNDSSFLRRLVYEHAGIALEADRDDLFELRLEPMLSEFGVTCVAELVENLRFQPEAHLTGQVVEAMATCETLFFRDFHPFELLRTHVIPQWLETRQPHEKLSVLSLACSSGQEPYSLAMLLDAHFPQLVADGVHIYASDFSERMIERARQGCYSRMEVNRGLPARFLVQYFEKTGDTWQVVDELRKRVSFEVINLARDMPSGGPADIIFLRNVLIYFDKPMKKHCLRLAADLLKPRGCLFLGAAETTINIDDSFAREQVEQAGFYRLRKK